MPIPFPSDFGIKSLFLKASTRLQTTRSLRNSKVLGLIAVSLICCLSAMAQQPPEITTEPQSQTVTNGNNALFAVTARGHKPLSYQWLFNALPIPGATNSDLVLTNVQCSHAGIYSVIVANIAGSIISTDAILVVFDTVPPTVTCRADYTTTECDCICFLPPLVFDNCDSNPTVQTIFSFRKIATNGLAEILRTCWRAYDRSGNTNQCCQDITIIPFRGYVPPTNSVPTQTASASAQTVSPTFTLQRGLPDINAGVTDSALGPPLGSPCGALSGTNLWFRIGSLDSGFASIRIEGATLSVVYEGYVCDPRFLTHVVCCPGANRQCQVQFSARAGLRYWLALEGVRSSIPLKVAYGFDPRIESIALKPDRAVALTSSIAPAVTYTLQAAPSLHTNFQSWSNLLTTRLTTNSYLSFWDTNAFNFNRRFYRIVPGL